MLYKKFEGKKIYFAPIDNQNIELITKWMNDETLTRGTGRVAQVFTETAQKELMEENSKKTDDYQFYVVRKNDDKILGIYNLHHIKQVHQFAKVGGLIGEIDERGKGYGSEALRMLCDFAFNILNLHTLVADIYSFNYPSIKSAEKVGFKKVGEIKECYYFGGKFYNQIIFEITKDEFNKKYKTFVLPIPDKIK